MQEKKFFNKENKFRLNIWGKFFNKIIICPFIVTQMKRQRRCALADLISLCTDSHCSQEKQENLNIRSGRTKLEFTDNKAGLYKHFGDCPFIQIKISLPKLQSSPNFRKLNPPACGYEKHSYHEFSSASFTVLRVYGDSWGFTASNSLQSRHCSPLPASLLFIGFYLQKFNVYVAFYALSSPVLTPLPPPPKKGRHINNSSRKVRAEKI